MELWKFSVAADGFFACGGKSSTTDNAEIVNLSCLRNIQFEDTNAGGESEAVENPSSNHSSLSKTRSWIAANSAFGHL